jgi:hypothetical protein
MMLNKTAFLVILAWLLIGVVSLVLGVKIAGAQEGVSPLVPPPAVEQKQVPLVYCHAQGKEWKDGVCVGRSGRQMSDGTQARGKRRMNFGTDD